MISVISSRLSLSAAVPMEHKETRVPLYVPIEVAF